MLFKTKAIITTGINSDVVIQIEVGSECTNGARTEYSITIKKIFTKKI
jgi:hypothetical protein